MARKDQAHNHNVDGPWFVDTRCIGCDVARHWAPGLIDMDDKGRSFVARQPQTQVETAALWRAAVACPTQSIGNREVVRPPASVFPYELTDGVYALGYNARSSFGGHSYLLPRPAGNLMVDSPRCTRGLAETVDRLGGVKHVLLSHRDEIADAEKWASRYDARVWIHKDDADAAPFATDITSTEEVVETGVVSIPIPGHTKGHVAYYVDKRWLFTGDALFWNHRRQELDITPKQTWYSWDVLADSMDSIAGLDVEWIFPAHGKWHQIGTDHYSRQMAKLGPAMRETGQQHWSQRAHTPFIWDE
ncbi:MAG: MBL fold metallo-hydrolase [Acidimicrobiia bacterium]|nr:MBL fold metallo-hydrolase [Acidimicrobiia bacterium]MYB75129.1 MBL fold metallo-hydrolase [Acidimicrobiia bacterium]MYI00255.1 MBL fold metallo-hydrolase [Acidimicrobiia bacterium]